jgi:solute carrier family 25, member 38
LRFLVTDCLKTAFQFSAGFLSGLTTSVLLQPADLLKTRVQQSPSDVSLAQQIRKILSSPLSPTRGPAFLSLYRGTLPSALRTSIGSALYFSGVTNLRTILQQIESKGGQTPLLSANATNLISGALARAGAGFAIMPITVLKVRFESSLHAYPTLRAAARDIYRERGFRSFFAGFGATAVRDAPYAGLYVLFYEAFKSRARSFLHVDNTSPSTNKSISSTKPSQAASQAGINFLSGILAASLATAITNPFDAVKTRLQLQPDRYANTFVALAKMLREEGWHSLFRGLGLRMGRKAVSSALAWTVYEELIRRWEARLVVG